MEDIYLYDSLVKKKKLFEPIDDENVRMYVCGPTVYDYPHIGNARSTVIYDVLYRILRHKYGKDKVCYVRNITDVDDKIVAKATQDNKSIEYISDKYLKIFLDNCRYLNCINPNIQPQAVAHIPDIINMIQTLIEKGFAYITSSGNVYFNIKKFSNYGDLSGKRIEDLKKNVRIINKEDKKNINDFALWKKIDDLSDHFYWDSPWGKGRPGWHIECSAMSTKYLGKSFDIHGGGIDLQFPHHENEIAQSICANGRSQFAQYWVHNGFVTVDGIKMSKSLKNIVTINELMLNDISGFFVRYALLSTHYRKPLIWNASLIDYAKKSMQKIYLVYDKSKFSCIDKNKCCILKDILRDILNIMYDDIKTPQVFSAIFKFISEISKNKNNIYDILYTLNIILDILGMQYTSIPEYRNQSYIKDIEDKIQLRSFYKKKKMFKETDVLTHQLYNLGISIEEGHNDQIKWYIRKIK
ncbi:cysteine--tRNA ligase [Anaplasmataceae bacterium AB001_6]|nr:cysteine--tRNA ligase [Anaplasmataceae bacterium AB001_6]